MDQGSEMKLQDFARPLGIAALFVATVGSASGEQWAEASTGIPSAVPYVSALTIDPATPSTIYATASDGRLFKSIDAAGSWTRLIADCTKPVRNRP